MKNKRCARILLYICVISAAAFTLAPVLYILSKTSLSGAEAFLKDPVYPRLLWNSVVIVVPVVLGQILISAPAAFAFETAVFKHKEALYVIYIVLLILPMQILLVPHYIIANYFGINDTLLAVILPALFNPFGVFLIRQQLKSFPKECLEAARADGASNWRLFKSIVLPNMAPVIASLSILTFAEYWNVVDQAVVFLHDPHNEPLSVYLSRLVQGDDPLVFAASALYMIPAVIVFLAGRKGLARGVSLSGIEK